MSNPVTDFLRRLGNKDNQSANQADPKPVVDSLPVPPQSPQGQPLPFPMPGQAILEGVLAEIDRLSSIERSIIAVRLLGSDEPLRGVKPEDWVGLIESRIGKAYAEAFRRWLGLRGCGELR